MTIAYADNVKTGRSGHVPIRDSLLTRLLANSFTGNCKTTFCVNVSPSPADYDETCVGFVAVHLLLHVLAFEWLAGRYSSLLLGARAMEITTQPKLVLTKEPVWKPVLQESIIVPTPVPTQAPPVAGTCDDTIDLVYASDEEDSSAVARPSCVVIC
jgi:hypothetical protein